MKIPCTHNLYKLRNLCPETDPSLRELIDAAELLTPFAVEARWPCSETLEQAQRNANRVADFVSARLRSVAWNVARARFDWRVDLRHFKDATKHPGFFDRVIEPANIVLFENTFRTALVPGGRRERAAEVAFWKNYGNFRGRDRITRDLFEWIEGPESWTRFAAAVEALAITPTWKAFQTAHHLLRPDVRVRYATYVSFVLRSTKIPYGRQENRRMVVWSISKRT